MTEYQNQGPGWQPPPQPPQGGIYTPPQHVQPPKKRKAPTWLIVTTAVLVGICGIGTIAVIATSGTEPDEPAAPGQREAPAAPAAEKPDPPDPVFAEPDPDDFELSIKTLEKQCFGSAGCNITFRIELAYDGPELDPTVTYEVTYEVKGGEDPYIATLTVTGDQYSTSEEDYIGTASSDSKLSAVVTDVSEF